MLLVAACSSGEDTGSGFGGLSTPTGASGPTSAPGSDTGDSGGSGGATGTTGASDSSDSSGGGGASTGSGAATSSAATEDSADPVPNPDGLPSGSECSDPGACMTGNCYKVPLPVGDLPPGICAECDADADCVAAGLGTACSVDASRRPTAATHSEPARSATSKEEQSETHTISTSKAKAGVRCASDSATTE